MQEQQQQQQQQQPQQQQEAVQKQEQKPESEPQKTVLEAAPPPPVHPPVAMEYIEYMAYGVLHQTAIRLYHPILFMSLNMGWSVAFRCFIAPSARLGKPSTRPNVCAARPTTDSAFSGVCG